MRFLSLWFLVAAASLSTCAYADFFAHQDFEGGVELGFDEESGEPWVSVNVVNPSNFSTCQFETHDTGPCSYTADGIRCFDGQGDVSLVIKFLEDGGLEVTQFPQNDCGMNVTALGRYEPAQAPGNVELFYHSELEGTLSLELTEDGDAYVKISTLNPDRGSTCDFDSSDFGPCNMSEGGFSCYIEDEEPVVLKFLEDGDVQVTSFPSSLCGMGCFATGVYNSQQNLGAIKAPDYE